KAVSVVRVFTVDVPSCDTPRRAYWSRGRMSAGGTSEHELVCGVAQAEIHRAQFGRLFSSQSLMERQASAFASRVINGQGVCCSLHFDLSNAPSEPCS